MSMRFKKSIKLSKNTKINFSKKSISFTAGTKHIHHTVSSNGSKTNSVGIPGTGISFVDRSSGNNHKTSKNSFNVSANNNYSEIRDVNKMSKYTDKQLKNNIIIFSIIAAVLALISIFNMPLGILLIVIALVLLIPIIKYGIELNIRKTTGNEYLTLEKETKNPYQKKTIIALIFLQPLGLYWMWVHTSWNKILKAIISLLCVSAVLFNTFFISAIIDPDSVETEPEVKTTETTTNTEKTSSQTEHEITNPAIISIDDKTEESTKETSSTTEKNTETSANSTTTTVKTTSRTTTEPTLRRTTTTKATTQKKTTVPYVNNNLNTVYITNTGKKYHNAGCRFLKDSSIAVSLDYAISHNYTPCGVCH